MGQISTENTEVSGGIYPNMPVEELVDAQVIDSSDVGKGTFHAEARSSEFVQAWMNLESVIRSLRSVRISQ